MKYKLNIIFCDLGLFFKILALRLVLINAIGFLKKVLSVYIFIYIYGGADAIDGDR
jgi:hypothetical protein